AICGDGLRRGERGGSARAVHRAVAAGAGQRGHHAGGDHQLADLAARVFGDEQAAAVGGHAGGAVERCCGAGAVQRVGRAGAGQRADHAGGDHELADAVVVGVGDVQVGTVGGDVGGGVEAGTAADAIGKAAVAGAGQR